MTLGEIIECIDEAKPNAFQPEDKTLWLNELERTIQTEVLQQTEDLTDHVWSDAWKGTGIRFPDDATMVIPGIFHARAGGRVDLEGLTDYPENNGTGYPVESCEIRDGTTVVTFAPGAFSETGAEEESAGASVYYDGYSEPMLAPERFHKIYYTYLEARIDAASSEWGEYANTLQLFNAFWGEYVRWYCRTYIDD